MRVVGRSLQALVTRLIPAIVTALGVVVVTAGLLAYSDPATAGVLPSPSASGAGPAPTLSLDLPTAEPSGGASGSPSPSASPGTAVVTRVVVPALRIDLPVVAGPKDGTYPYCNVAMYYEDPRLGQPGSGKPTYLFAHARDGMFGPIYHLTIQLGTPSKMVGDIVQVYTSDNKLYYYEITAVYPHQPDLSRPLADARDELWLQTSEGYHVAGKTQVLAMPFSVGAANPVSDAHPAVPKNITCPDAPKG